MSEARVIKKYPNRRLYDTEESRYITLSDVRELVIKKIEFVVMDKKSGDDITRSILLQVISEQEQQGEAIMSQDFLSQVIRSYGSVVPGFMANYLEQSLKLFMVQQQNIRGQVKRVVGVDDMAVGFQTRPIEAGLHWQPVADEFGVEGAFDCGAGDFAVALGIVAVADIAQKNFARWKALQDEVLKRFTGSSREPQEPPEQEPSTHRKRAG